MGQSQSTEKFAERLRASIERAGYRNVQQFCLDKKYPGTLIYKWLRGAHQPRPDLVLRLAQDLGVNPGWLLFGDEGGPAPKPTSAEGTTGGIMSTRRKPLATIRVRPRRQLAGAA